MNVAIVYDSRTGTTRAAAEAMSRVLIQHGHQVQVTPVGSADPAQVAGADLVCVGSWTQGLFLVLQHATRATREFLERLGDLSGKQALVFCTYKVATGSMLPRMAAALEAKGARVVGRFRWRGPDVDEAFRRLAAELGRDR